MSVRSLWTRQEKTDPGRASHPPTPLDELRRARRDGTECDVATLPPRRADSHQVVTGLPPALELTRCGDARPSAAAIPAGATLLLPDGTHLSLRHATSVGRAPRPRPDVAPLVLADPTRSVSRDHALLEPADAGVAVTDLGSGNGTAVTTPDGVVRRLVPGLTQQAPPGSVIALGDLVVTVEHPTDGWRTC